MGSSVIGALLICFRVWYSEISKVLRAAGKKQNLSTREWCAFRVHCTREEMPTRTRQDCVWHETHKHTRICSFLAFKVDSGDWNATNVTLYSPKTHFWTPFCTRYTTLRACCFARSMTLKKWSAFKILSACHQSSRVQSVWFPFFFPLHASGRDTEHCCCWLDPLHTTWFKWEKMHVVARAHTHFASWIQIHSMSSHTAIHIVDFPRSGKTKRKKRKKRYACSAREVESSIC